MKKTILVDVMTVQAVSLFAVATILVPLNILSAQADPYGEEKFWGAEDDSAEASVECTKDNGGCKGVNVNKEVRELCKEISEVRCKQDH